LKLLITLIGMVMILEGIPYFTMPDTVRQVAAMIMSAESRSLRLIGLSLMLLGLVLAALGRSM